MTKFWLETLLIFMGCVVVGIFWYLCDAYGRGVL